MSSKKPRLGSHLEWHGNQIRVTVAIPPSLRPAMGKTKLRQFLPTREPRVADKLKWSVIAELKRQIEQERQENGGTEDDANLMDWRDIVAKQGPASNPHDFKVLDAFIDDVLPEIEAGAEPTRRWLHCPSSKVPPRR